MSEKSTFKNDFPTAILALKQIQLTGPQNLYSLLRKDDDPARIPT